MSDTDSFIEEVTEEVKRDKLFAMIRRYGWVAVLLVLLIVGGAAYNEVRKSQQQTAAQASGDAILAALQSNDNNAAASLESLQTDSAQAQVVADLLLGAEQIGAGDTAGAAETFDAIAMSGSDVPAIYRDIAAFKSILARAGDLPMAERRSALEALANPGAPLALLAQEQLALADIEDGDQAGAIARLNGIVEDASVTAGLRRRASQLIVALGGTPADVSGAGFDQ
ncbi:MAG: hypothetical protein ACU0BK_00445 [Shimia sp.]|uniref:hypothetical protein n=1 Tax=Shimia sp. TaxID=1954381 RepID=UPI004059DC1F